jgi:endonuclease YncB( thermonuclease family)
VRPAAELPHFRRWLEADDRLAGRGPGRDRCGRIAAICGCFCAAAQERPRPAIACGAEAIARGTFSRVIDGRTFVLGDGREVRLAAIEVPPLPPPPEPSSASVGLAARDALATLLASTEVVLRQAEPQRTDRYGRVVAFASTARDGVERSVQGDLIAAGLVRVAARGRRSRLRCGTPRPRKRRAERQAWPLGRFVL